MSTSRLSKLEFRIMEVLWEKGDSSIREVQESFPASGRPAYTTIQTTVYRMEAKKVLRRARKIGNFHIFSASITRDIAQRSLIDELLAAFGGRPQAVMVHLVESGKLSIKDVKDAEKLLRKLSGEETR